MTDTSSVTGNGQNSAAGGATGDKQDPMAVLENILKEAQQKQAAGDGGVSVGAAGGAEPADVAPTEAQKVQLRAEEAAHQVQVEAERKRLIEVQRQQIAQEVMTSPQYQAKVSQEKDIQKDKAAHEVAGEGFDIIQLKHDKIPVSSKDQP